MEREDAAGHGGQEEGKEETEGMSEQLQARGPGSSWQQLRTVPVLWFAEIDRGACG